MAAVGLEDQLLPGSPEYYSDITVAGSDGQALWIFQMFPSAFPKSSCALSALLYGAGGLPMLLMTAAVELGGKRECAEMQRQKLGF